jgi:hypothetical protein
VGPGDSTSAPGKNKDRATDGIFCGIVKKDGSYSGISAGIVRVVQALVHHGRSIRLGGPAGAIEKPVVTALTRLDSNALR